MNFPQLNDLTITVQGYTGLRQVKPIHPSLRLPVNLPNKQYKHGEKELVKTKQLQSQLKPQSKEQECITYV